MIWHKNKEQWRVERRKKQKKKKKTVTEMRARHKKKDQRQHFAKLVQAATKVFFSSLLLKFSMHIHTHKQPHTHSYIYIYVYFDLCISNKNYNNEGADMGRRKAAKSKCEKIALLW